MVYISIISSIMDNFLHKNKVHKFTLAFGKRNVWKICILFGTLARQVEKLACRLTRWNTKLKHWNTLWYVGKKDEKLARFWYVGTQTRWHVDHVGTQARMACNLANSVVLYVGLFITDRSIETGEILSFQPAANVIRVSRKLFQRHI